MGGPMPNLTPGYKISSASAIRCAEECQNVDFPFLSFQVRILIEEASVMGRARSHTSPFTSIANETRAKPSLMLAAISEPFTPRGYSRTLPSGREIFTFMDLN